MTITVAVKTSSLAVTGWGNMSLELPQSSILREFSLFDLHSSFHKRACLYLFWTKACSARHFICTAFVKDNHRQLFNITVTWGGNTCWENKRLAQILKSGEWDVPIGSFEKLWRIPGNLEGHIHVRGSVHPQESLKKAPISHLWLILGVWRSRKWWVQASCKLPETSRCVPTYTENPSEKDGRLICWHHIRKSLQSLDKH